MADD
jgi:hypothetical protein